MAKAKKASYYVTKISRQQKISLEESQALLDRVKEVYDSFAQG